CFFCVFSFFHPTFLVSPFFLFHYTATPEFYTLSLHDALPIYHIDEGDGVPIGLPMSIEESGTDPSTPYKSSDNARRRYAVGFAIDRKSTRLNSSHVSISYAVFCLKKKKKYLITSMLILFCYSI